jgi:toxin ParE1/3/4
MARIVWTEEALTWLNDIGNYLKELSPTAAVRVTQGIYKKTQLLIDHPQIGFRIVDIEDRDVRELLYGHYRIVYELRNGETAYVLAVFHSSLDIERLQF